MDRTAPTDHPVLPAIAARWSPRSYLETPVPDAALHSILEAGRWAASAYNEQPWQYLITRRALEPEAFAKLLACLVPFNQGWIGGAPVLMLACARLNSAGNGKPNPWSHYDAGQASSAMAIQAAALGLQLHQMAGFDAAAARAAFAIPEDVAPIAAMVLGTPGPASALPEALAQRETAPRARKPAGEMFFLGQWG
ncbi:nitroreductase family protein [Sediminicoccus sp. KRV36]|uniref:nitroreductase family protein n=1 Tax=Sediminicoccus sp. KRV36 TaxID=3133721 RepID=UPI00200D6E94|nr:nitroreductase family protein [Sediminicoccus rosea]UPY38329.1 nitroreductase family protein [Sediminicoccus rosea]